MKTCKKCKQLKSLDFFSKNRQIKGGFDRVCKQCWSGQSNLKPMKKTNKKSPHFSGSDLSNLRVNAIKRARIKGLDFDLSTNYLHDLVHKFCENNRYNWSSKHPFKPSIDRIDNSKGYTTNNIKIIWLIENYCKNTYSDDQVIEFCKEKLKKVGILHIN